jgi:hypothetical protein
VETVLWIACRCDLQTLRRETVRSWVANRSTTSLVDGNVNRTGVGYPDLWTDHVRTERQEETVTALE